LQLLEPERYPYLYKVLYGILMLLPQSAAFAALKNRLNSVSAIGYLHIPSSATTRGGIGGGGSSGMGASSSSSANSVLPAAFERANRLKPRDDGPVKWAELLDKFRTTQDRARRSYGRPAADGDAEQRHAHDPLQRKMMPAAAADLQGRQQQQQQQQQQQGRTAGGGAAAAGNAAAQTQTGHRSKFSTSSLGMGRFASGVKARAKK